MKGPGNVMVSRQGRGSSVDVRDRWFDRQRCLRGDAGQMALRRVRRMSRRSHV